MKGAKKGKGEAPAAKPITDSRFASFETDPRFRLPSKKNAKTKLDKRFAGMLNDEDFTATAKVDRYGRKIKSDSKKKALERLYEAEDDEVDSDDDEKDEDEENIEVEDDDVVRRELRAANAKYDPARGGGFASSDSESDSESDSDSDDEDGGVGLQTDGDMQKLQDEHTEVEAGEVTSRIAIVNLDWDHVSSTDLMALFSSFIGADESGRVTKISVYPSEFGKERMQQEEVEGPPKALFKGKKKDDSDSDSDDSDSDSDDGDEKIKKQLMQEGDDQDFDSDALRSYQLDRLRYYYAVMECSSPAIAKKIYEATDGTEYQSSSNFIDLRFVPDDVTFDDEPRDVCDRVPESYKPVEFVTTALQSSKVKLTWDTHPEEATRKESIKRAFTGSRAQIEENDLRAYLASDSEGSDDEVQEYVAEDEVGENPEEPAEPKLSKKELARKKMREALGLTDEPAAKSKSGKEAAVGGMQITFTPALSENSKSKNKAANGEEEEETTIEKYKRKERERKEKKREAARAKRAANEGEDDNSDGGEMQISGPADDNEGNNGDDLGFDDPFFTAEDPSASASKSSIRKAERLKKREARLAAEATSAAERAHLSKVMGGDDGSRAEHLDHFDMNEILRAEKQAAKRAKGKSKKNKNAPREADASALQQGFEMDVGDKRFQAVFDSHEYAIDPSNPKFKASSGMKKLLEEGRKKRRGGEDDGGERRERKRAKGRR